MTISEFYAARLDEDEAAAQAVEDNSAPWDGQWRARGPYLETYSGLVLATAAGGEHGAPGVIEHAARYDPARMLREVAAGRAILAAHGPDPVGKFGSVQDPRCLVCLTDRDGYEESWEADPWPCSVLRHRVAVYSDHPDYEAGWKP